MTYVLLLLGFVLLVKGADFFVDGSSSIAKLLKVPSIIIGLTVVAFGTSMPEASVSITAALQGQNGLAVSNVIGSNMFNLLVVLGASALMKPLVANKEVIKKELPFSMIMTVVLLVGCMAPVLLGGKSYELGRALGILLLIVFILFVAFQIKEALRARGNAEEEEYEVMSPVKSLLFIVGGIVAIVYGGDLVVNSATDIAVSFGFSQTFIGLTIVAMGTSLPELVTSVVAAKKGETDLALGNVVGSNIFNILLILGSSAAICPIEVGILNLYDMGILLVMSLLVYLCAKSQSTLSKKEGILFLLVYFVYFGYIYTR